MAVDGLDARLLRLLADEPRIGVLECSRRLGVARGTVQARLDRLQARGVGLLGGVERYEDSYRLCYVRGPEGIIVALAQQLS